MTDFDVVVPVLHAPTRAGGIDRERTRDYAQVAAASWVDYFLVSGSTTGGRDLSTADRSVVLDIWVDIVGPQRLLAGSWTTSDLIVAGERDVLPIAVMTPDAVGADALQWLRELPRAAIYSHPVYGGPTWTPALAHAAAAAGCLPVGGKVSKVGVDVIADLHSAAPAFALWDGSARHIQRSIGAGAAGVVLTPLAGQLDRLPAKEIDAVQAVVDPVQVELDRITGQAGRRQYLLDMACW